MRRCYGTRGPYRLRWNAQPSAFYDAVACLLLAIRRANYFYRIPIQKKPTIYWRISSNGKKVYRTCYGRVLPDQVPKWIKDRLSEDSLPVAPAYSPYRIPCLLCGHNGCRTGRLCVGVVGSERAPWMAELAAGVGTKYPMSVWKFRTTEPVSCCVN